MQEDLTIQPTYKDLLSRMRWVCEMIDTSEQTVCSLTSSHLFFPGQAQTGLDGL